MCSLCTYTLGKFLLAKVMFHHFATEFVLTSLFWLLEGLRGEHGNFFSGYTLLLKDRFAARGRGCCLHSQTCQPVYRKESVFVKHYLKNLSPAACKHAGMCGWYQ